MTECLSSETIHPRWVIGEGGVKMLSAKGGVLAYVPVGDLYGSSYQQVCEAWRTARQQAERMALYQGSPAAVEEPKADYHGPNDAAHKAVHDVTEHLLGGRVTSAPARAQLRRAIDIADAMKPPVKDGVKPFAGNVGRSFTSG
jgi:hypothetical protein